jgi:hypothetical protein
MYRRNVALLTTHDPKERKPDPKNVTAMVTLFLYWLEYNAIENGAQVERQGKP